MALSSKRSKHDRIQRIQRIQELQISGDAALAKVIFVSVTKCDRKHKEGQYRGTLTKNDTFMASRTSFKTSSFQYDLYFVTYNPI